MAAMSPNVRQVTRPLAQSRCIPQQIQFGSTGVICGNASVCLTWNWEPDSTRCAIPGGVTRKMTRDNLKSPAFLVM